MRQKIDLFTPKSIKNSTKNDDFAVFYAQNSDGIEVFLYGVVGDEYTQTDAGSIARVLSANRNAPVTMRVNSFGGLAFDGMAIYNALADHAGPTVGIIESVAASAASLAVLESEGYERPVRLERHPDICAWYYIPGAPQVPCDM